MACASMALVSNISSHGYGQQVRFNADFSNSFSRSRVLPIKSELKKDLFFGFSCQDSQLTVLTKKAEKLGAQANLSSQLITEEIVNMSFVDRLKLAWKIIFPKTPLNPDSNAQIAKQRLKMVLFSDRCAVSDLAKKRILENVIKTLSEFVEIESRDKVELNVSTDADIGTVYSVTVPVRRVKPDYQESDENYKGQIVGIEYKDMGENDGNVDVTFDFYVPNEN